MAMIDVVQFLLSTTNTQGGQTERDGISLLGLFFAAQAIG